MAELQRTHPLEAWTVAFKRLPDTVGIAAEPFVARTRSTIVLSALLRRPDVPAGPPA